MPKRLLQDIVKAKHTVKTTEVKNTRPYAPEQIEQTNKPRSRYGLWIVATVSILFFLFALSYLFSTAQITVSPKMQSVVINENLSAKKGNGADILPFDSVIISGDESKTVVATEEKELSERAEGLVIIYNTFSSASQRLNIDTRLEGSNGKIYKTKTATVVSGKVADKPGSVEVKIYADLPGEAYNSAPLDFTILGFKGTPKYTKFYARSKGEITGGFKGMSKVISDALKVNVINELKNALQAKLLKKATDQMPSGFVLFKDATFFNVDEENIPFTSIDGNLAISLKGTLNGIIFNEKKLTDKIVKDNIENYDGSDVYIPNIKDLNFSTNSISASNLADIKNINFNLSGNAKVVWKFDSEKLATELLGKSKKDFKQIISEYTNINSADLVLSPFFKISFPDKLSKIKVIVNYPK